jgi:hypothetical protein
MARKNGRTYLQFIQALPLFRGLECLLASVLDAREDSDIIARMEGRKKKSGAGA